MSEPIAQKKVKVSIELRKGSARFRVGVQARSIREALDLVAKRYRAGEVRYVFLVEPAGFFVRETSAPARSVDSLRPHAEAA
jgi:hypothetical protein